MSTPSGTISGGGSSASAERRLSANGRTTRTKSLSVRTRGELPTPRARLAALGFGVRRRGGRGLRPLTEAVAQELDGVDLVPALDAVGVEHDANARRAVRSRGDRRLEPAG